MSEIWMAAAAVVAAGATTYSAKSASDSAKKAQNTNLANASSDRALQQYFFDKSRGADGSPVFSPYYTGSYESDTLYPAARGAFEGAFPVGEDAQRRRLVDYKGFAEGMRPAFQAGTNTVNDIFSGALTGERTANAQPVAAARRTKGATSAGAINEEFKARLAAIDAQRLKGGFNKSGTTAQNALFRAAVPFRAGAADARAQAELENAMMFSSIKDQGVDLRLRSLDLPLQRYQQQIQFENAPGQALVDQYMRATQPLGMFNINPETFRPSPTPTVSAIPGTGSAVAAGIGSAGNSFANYFANQQIAQLFQQMAAAKNPASMTYGGPLTTSSAPFAGQG